MENVTTAAGTYYRNLTTQKIELSFEKSAYMALSDDQKKEIKRHYLWSRFASAWVSRSSQNTYSAEQVAKNLGLDFTGNTGEKLSFADQVERQQEKAANRADRFENKAATIEKESTAAFSRSSEMASHIPFGQPILVGHHSEKWDRRYRERIHNLMGKSVELSKKADHYADRAETARHTAEGSQYSNPRYLGNRIKENESILKALLKNQKPFLDRLEDKKIYDKVLQEYRDIKPEEEETIFKKLIEGAEYYQEKIDDVNDKLNFFRACVEKIGGFYTKEALKEKQVLYVNYRGTWYPVKSLNAQSVTVLNWMGIAGAAWTWNVKYSEVKGIKCVGEAFQVFDRDGNESKPTIKYKK